MTGTVEVALKLLKREPVSLTQLDCYTVDSKSKRLIATLKKLNANVKALEQLVNPPVEPLQTSMEEQVFSNMLKNYYRSRRCEISNVLSSLIKNVLLLVNCLLDVSPVLLELGLVNALQEMYKAVLTLTEKVNENLVTLCDTARFTDEILKFAAELQTSFERLKTTLNHLIITPLTSSIQEEARNQIVNSLRRKTS